MKTDKVMCGFTRPQSGRYIYEGEMVLPDDRATLLLFLYTGTAR